MVQGATYEKSQGDIYVKYKYTICQAYVYSKTEPKRHYAFQPNRKTQQGFNGVQVRGRKVHTQNVEIFQKIFKIKGVDMKLSEL